VFNLYEESEFNRHLSKFSCLMIGIGGLIGGGIFSVIGVITVFTGPYSYISYLLTGIITLFTVYSYGKLNNKWNGPGGEYTCIKNALSNTSLHNLGAIVGLLLYLGYIGSMSLYAYTFSVYLLFLFNIKPNLLFISIIVIIIFLFFTLLNLKGIKESSRFQNILVMTKIIILLLFSILGLLYASNNISEFITNVGLNSESFTNINVVGIVLGSSSIIVSYQGFQLIGYASHEMKDVEGGLKMMKWSLVISMFIYCVVSFTALAILGVTGIIGEGIDDAEVAIANAALNFLGPYGMIIIIIGALISTGSAINATILGSSRLAYRMAKDGIISKSLAKVSKNKVPYLSIIIISFLSVGLTIISGGALPIARITGLIFAQIFFIINFSNYKINHITESKKIFPIIGMVFTALLFIVLIIHMFLNIQNEITTLISFFVMEGAAIVFVRHIYSDKVE
jgi:amino acid transporter